MELLQIDVLPILKYRHVLALLVIVMKQTVWRLAVHKDEGRKNNKCAERVEVSGTVTACNTYVSR